MKIIAMGDTHGRTSWKDILASRDWDKAVFLGDYFDSHDGISATKQLKNFREILRYKKENPEKVVLLLGNHDFHYLKEAQEEYSGYQFRAADKINAVLQPAVDEGLIQICFRYKRYMFSHAGITKTWLNNKGYAQYGSMDEFINLRFHQKPEDFRFRMGINRSGTGDDVCQSPLWVRPASLRKDAIPDYIQIVGHTMHENITFGDGIYFIDTLGTSGEYLYVDGDEVNFEILD